MTRVASRLILLLCLVAAIAIPRASASARAWMLADQRLWTVSRACRDGVVITMVHEASLETPGFVPDPIEDGSVTLAVRKITAPAPPWPESDGKLLADPADFGPQVLVPGRPNPMASHVDPLTVDPYENGTGGAFYYYAIMPLVWHGDLVAGVDRVVVIADIGNNPNSHSAVVATITDCHVSDYLFLPALGSSQKISSARLKSTSPHLAPAALTYTLGLPPFRGFLLRDAVFLNTGNTFTQEDVNNGRIRYYSPPFPHDPQVDSFGFRPMAISRVSVGSNGEQTGDDANYATISGNGRFVAFSVNAPFLVPGFPINTTGVFLRDRDTDSNGIFDEPGHVGTSPVSVGLNNTLPNNMSYGPSLSTDGRYVAFTSLATNLVSGSQSGFLDIYVSGGGKVVRVSVATDGTLSNGASDYAAISANGRFVAFDSRASNLVPGAGTSFYKIFVRDRDTDGNGVFDEPGKVSTEVISRAINAQQVNGDSLRPSISADGRYVSFFSQASNLVANDTNNAEDVFLYDRVNHTTQRVSMKADGTQTGQHSESFRDALSADGRYLAFQSLEPDVYQDRFGTNHDNNNAWDVYIYDRVANHTERVSNIAGGTDAPDDASEDATISADGRRVAFTSFATNVVTNDLHVNCNQGVPYNCPDQYVFDRELGQTIQVSRPVIPQTGSFDSGISGTQISADGNFVAFDSFGGHLGLGGGEWTDIYVALAGFWQTFPVLPGSPMFLPSVLR